MAALLIFEEETRRHIRRARVFRDRSNVLDSLTDVELISRYRFPRRSIMELTELVAEDISRATSRSHPIPVHIQVLATLRFLGKGDYQSETGDLHGISRSSVSRCITGVCNSLCSRLDNISFPTDAAELRVIKHDFHAIAGFPNVVGAIDGTLIPIQGMSGDDEKMYVCRKGYHSLNIQAVVDANMRFLNINCKFPGSTHDAYILSTSNIPHLMEGLPEGGWLLGDSGYPLKSWLMTPVNHPATPQEMHYNKSHSTTRTVVERSFEVLKSRFRCIHKTGGSLPYSPIKCSRIIETSFRLHNKAINDRIPLMQGGQIVNLFQDHVCHNANREAQTIRARVISQF